MNPLEVQIRPGDTVDVPRLTELATELGYPVDADTLSERLVGLAADERQRLLIAQSGGSVIGWLQVSDSVAFETGRRAEIVGLVVGAAARRRGVGRALVLAAEQWARQRGIERLVVRSNVMRIESHAFYPALGFTRAKTQAVYQKSIERG